MGEVGVEGEARSWCRLELREAFCPALRHQFLSISSLTTATSEAGERTSMAVGSMLASEKQGRSDFSNADADWSTDDD